MKLEPCDVLVYLNEGKDPISRFSKWAIGPFDHVSIYLGKAHFYPPQFSIPVLYESEGRGVAIKSLVQHTGRRVGVFRPALSFGEKYFIMRWAVSIAGDPKSYYDYLSIVTNCVPRVLKEKFPWLPIPPQYHRDPAMICSEAVAELFWLIGIEVVPRDVIPLPMDFTYSPVLQYMGSGTLIETVKP